MHPTVKKVSICSRTLIAMYGRSLFVTKIENKQIRSKKTYQWCHWSAAYGGKKYWDDASDRFVFDFTELRSLTHKKENTKHENTKYYDTLGLLQQIVSSMKILFGTRKLQIFSSYHGLTFWMNYIPCVPLRLSVVLSPLVILISNGFYNPTNWHWLRGSNVIRGFINFS